MGEVEGWREEGRGRERRERRREEEREVGRERRRERKRGGRKEYCWSQGRYTVGEAPGLGQEVGFSHTQLLLKVITHSIKLSFVFIKVTSNSLHFSQGVPVEEEEEGNKLQVLLKHIESPFVQSNPAVREGLMHIIPFLTFGDPKNMNILLQHFAPYLNFEK